MSWPTTVAGLRRGHISTDRSGHWASRSLFFWFTFNLKFGWLPLLPFREYKQHVGHSSPNSPSGTRNRCETPRFEMVPLKQIRPPPGLDPQEVRHPGEGFRVADPGPPNGGVQFGFPLKPPNMGYPQKSIHKTPIHEYCHYC